MSATIENRFVSPDRAPVHPGFLSPFQTFGKIPRLSREVVVTEKIDGTNAQLLIVPTKELTIGTQTCYWDDEFAIFAGSRTRWIFPAPGLDNHGFAAWVAQNGKELTKLGPGRHFGEWWGSGIQRGYGLKEKRFSLFNVGRWEGLVDGAFVPAGVMDIKTQVCGPQCVSLVPILYQGPFCTNAIHETLLNLSRVGSFAAPGFMDPEGIVVYHTASGHLYKKTCQDDEKPKGQTGNETPA